MSTRIANWRFAVAIAAAVVAVAGAAVVYRSLSREQRVQPLPGGTKLILTRVAYGTRNEFRHGTALEKLLGDLIPTNGTRVAWLALRRPSHEPAFDSEKPQLVIEFKLRFKPNVGVPEPAGGFDFAGRAQCVISGADGFEYTAWLWPRQFTPYRGEFFAYVVSPCFPRDSKWLHIRIDQRGEPREPWHATANFTIQNPTHSAKLPWVAQLPSIMTTNGMEFALGEVTLDTRSGSDSDPWKQPVLLPFRVRTNGVTLTNWTPAHIAAGDTTGNWDRLGTRPGLSNGWTIVKAWRFLNPRSVWKLEVDFSPQSNFPLESLLTLKIPSNLRTPLTTNFFGIPVAFSWVNQYMLAAEMPTNATHLRLLFVKARDAEGRDLDRTAGSWGQHHFWRMLDHSEARDFVEATVAVVPNVHATYFIQPKLVPSSGTNR
jgi:hypothetical protein